MCYYISFCSKVNKFAFLESLLGYLICDSIFFLVSFGFAYFNYCPKDVYFAFEWLLLIKPMDTVISTKFSQKSTDTQGVFYICHSPVAVIYLILGIHNGLREDYSSLPDQVAKIESWRPVNTLLVTIQGYVTVWCSLSILLLLLLLRSFFIGGVPLTGLIAMILGGLVNYCGCFVLVISFI